jgi:hypothetical protein
VQLQRLDRLREKRFQLFAKVARTIERCHSVDFLWPTNLIGYDALKSYGSPSYYLQVMFDWLHGDVVLPTTLTTPGAGSAVVLVMDKIHRSRRRNLAALPKKFRPNALIPGMVERGSVSRGRIATISML